MVVKKMKDKEMYICSECGSRFPCFYGKCPSCNAWGSIEQEKQVTVSAPGSANTRQFVEAVRVCENIPEPKRIESGVKELDRVLGGGFTEGMVGLLAGEPGVGKSTLLMQTCLSMASAGKRVLYFSGEESVYQISGRAKRLSFNKSISDNLHIITDTVVEQAVSKISDYDFFVVDSIQMVRSDVCASLPGSPAQIKTSAGMIIDEMKRTNTPCILVGHITKDGEIAGPKFLEHMVDGIFVFEGDVGGQYRILKSSKNRYGSTDETGVFEMTEQGLISVDDPSRTFWEKREGGFVINS